MALIKCPECKGQVSDTAESCPHCGYVMRLSDMTEDKVEIPAEVKEAGKKYDRIILIIKRIRYISIAIFIILMFVYSYLGNEAQDDLIYNIFCICLVFVIALCVGIWYINLIKGRALGEWSEQYEVEENGKLTANICPKCGSNNIDISINTVGETYKGRNEVRKKSAITRSANKKGRRAMNVATMGLWSLTPKKSEYKEIQKGTVTYNQVKTCVCQKCGTSWNIL